MKFEDLPVEIQCKIFKYGELGVSEALNLMKVSSVIKKKLQNEDFWKEIFYREWGKFIHMYEIEESNDNKSELKSYEKTLSYYKKKKKVLKIINDEKNKMGTKIQKLLKIVQTEKNIESVIIGIHLDHKKEIKSLINDQFFEIDLIKSSIIKNLYNLICFKIGLDYIKKKEHEKKEQEDEEDFEKFWFSISLFYSPLHFFIEERKKKIELIKSDLYKKIYVEELLNKVNYGIFFVHKKEKDEICFQNDSVFIKFVFSVSKIILKNFYLNRSSFEYDPDLCFTENYLENFDILKFYSNEFKVETILVRCFLVKFLSFFFNQFKIQIGDEKIVKLKINLTKKFISIRSYYLIIQSISRFNQNYIIKIYTKANLILFYKDFFNHDHEIVSNYFQMIDYNYCLNHYIDSEISYCKKSSIIIYRQNITYENFLNSFHQNQKDSINFTLPQKYDFVTFILKLIKNFSDSNLEIQNLNEMFSYYLIRSNNFIYYNYITDYIKKKNSCNWSKLLFFFTKKNNVKISHSFFLDNFNLDDPNDYLSFKNIFFTYFSNNQISDHVKDSTGSIVWHLRSKKLSVILGLELKLTTNKKWYHSVYSETNNVQICNSNVFIKVKLPETYNKVFLYNFVIYILNCFGFEFIGLLFFDSLRLEESLISFHNSKPLLFTEMN